MDDNVQFKIWTPIMQNVNDNGKWIVPNIWTSAQIFIEPVLIKPILIISPQKIATQS